MRNEILKIAKVKNEKDFYSKYPTEEAFMAKHGKAFAKAQMGTSIQDRGQLKKLDQLTSFKKGGKLKKAKNGYPDSFDTFKTNLNTQVDQSLATSLGQIKAKAPASMNSALQSINPQGAGFMDKIGGMAGIMSTGVDLVQGIQMFKQEKEAKDQAEQFASLSGVVNQASSIRPEGPKRKYVRPEDQIFDPNQMSPTYGTGSNFLQAQMGTTIPDRYNPQDSTYTITRQRPLGGGMYDFSGKSVNQLRAKQKAMQLYKLNPDGGKKTSVSDSLKYSANKKLKKGGEIQNTYAPGTLYDDLGYEPLSDSNIIKAQFGAQAGSLGSKLFGGTGEQSGAGQMGSTVGETIGKLTFIPGMGMVGGALGGLIGGAFGAKNQKDTARFQKEGMQNMQNAAFEQGTANWQSQNAAFVKHGGDINPQIISNFGGHNLYDLLKPDPTMDTLRAGGHLKKYREPSEEAMTPYAMGGSLKTHWGGKAEVQSYNPYLPGGGESVEFKGQSHDESDGNGNTGIGVTYEDSPVEVQGKEPAQVMKDGGNSESLVVFGDMVDNKKFGGSGRKFQNIVADLNKIEAKQNKIVDKGIEYINNADYNNPYDSLKGKTGEAMRIGGNMELKNIAQEKQELAGRQNAILQTADEYGLKPDELAKGKFKKDTKAIQNAQHGTFHGTFLAKDSPFMQWVRDFQTMPGNKPRNESVKPQTQSDKSEKPWYAPENESLTGNTMSTALKQEQVKQNWGEKLPLYHPKPYEYVAGSMESTPTEGYIPTQESQTRFEVNPYSLTGEGGYGQYYHMSEGQSNGVGNTSRPNDIRNKIDPITTTKKKASGRIDSIRNRLENMKPERIADIVNSDITSIGDPNFQPVNISKRTAQDSDITQKTEGKSNLSWMDAVGAYLPYLRPSNQKNLDPNQLMGEMYGLSTNQIDPVLAQKYSPLLKQVTDYSLQDRLNANQADFNSMQRQFVNNPEALAALAAQKYGANSSVLADQFRINQEQKQGVYNENRGILNDATLKNLGIFDQQYQRQSQAKSNTKAVAQAALSSISDKIAKNKLENRTLGVYENMYNYRFGPNGRAINMNAPLDTDQMVDNASTEALAKNENMSLEDMLAEVKKYTTEQFEKRKANNKKTVAKNGSIVRAIKR